MRRPADRRAWGPAFVTGLLAFLLTVAWQHQVAVGRRTEDRRAQLASVIQTRQERTAALERRLAELRARADRAASRSGQRELRSLRRRAEEISALSGTTVVEGPGVRVILSDAPDSDRTSTDTSSRIQDLDLQAVVNALWAAGAEAIAINGQRLVATSAIRNAGAAVLVNFKVLTSPYHVDALGDVETLRERFAASDIAAHFERWSEIYALGFAIEEHERLRLSAYRGSLRFRYAEPLAHGG